MWPDQRQPVKAEPLRGGACGASLDRLSPARQGLAKQAKAACECGSTPMRT